MLKLGMRKILCLVGIWGCALTFAARTVTVVIPALEYLTLNIAGERTSVGLSCQIANPSTVSQTLTVTSLVIQTNPVQNTLYPPGPHTGVWQYSWAFSAPISFPYPMTTIIPASRAFNFSFQAALAATPAERYAHFPRQMTFSIAENAGYVQGNCAIQGVHQNAGVNDMSISHPVPINGGKPF